MLTPIEDLGFSHDVEEGDDEWDGLEKVYAKFTVQWYVDPIRRQFCRPFRLHAFLAIVPKGLGTGYFLQNSESIQQFISMLTRGKCVSVQSTYPFFRELSLSGIG